MAVQYQLGFPDTSDTRDMKTICASTVDSISGLAFTLKASGEGPTGAYPDQKLTVIVMSEAPTTTNLPGVKVPALVYDNVNGKLHVAVGTFGATPTSYAAQA